MLFRAIITRFFQAIPTVFGIVTLVFLLIHLIPGDPVDALLGEHALPADREAMRIALHLDRPLMEQYGDFLTGVLVGEWGESIIDHRPVFDRIVERLPATLELAIWSLLLASLLALPLGYIAARHANSTIDISAMSFSLLGVSIPNFWLGPLLMLFFSIMLGWLPVSGRGSAAHLVLPVITLGTALAAVLSRMLRSALLEAMSLDAIRTARAMGVNESQLWKRHAGRLAMVPVVTMFALQTGALLTGAVITETVFDWPGLGLLTIEAIQQRDYPLVQASIMVIACFYLAANLCADIFSQLLDPRQRHG
ncbi:MAG: ABC transporter permease [Mariprofundaceae bacterium]